MKAQFSQKITGNRKAVMEAIAAITHRPVNYTKAPLFAYENDYWYIDREGVLTSPVFGMSGGGPLYHADLIGSVGKQGFAAEGVLTVTIYPDDFDPGHLGNMNAILSGKATLIRHALGMEVLPSAHLYEGETLEKYALAGGFTLPFFPAAMTYPGILSALEFSERVHALAASQTKVRTKDVPVENEKYAMRCFLLRLGMIGRVYATARKELLSRLSGDSSFKSGPRPGNATAVKAAAPRGNCLVCTASMSEPGDGCDRLFCVERQEYVAEDGFCDAFNR